MKKNVLLLETVASEADELLRKNTIVHEAFQPMKPGAFLIKTARGPIIDESALLKALDRDKISGFLG